MKIDKISLQILYPTGAFANVRPSMEATLEDGDTPEQCLTQLKERLDNWFWEAHPELSQQRGTQVTAIVDKETQVDKVPDEITTALYEIGICETLEKLKGYWFLSKSNLVLSTAYKKREKQLTDAK